jgi:hypothetical protein
MSKVLARPPGARGFTWMELNDVPAGSEVRRHTQHEEPGSKTPPPGSDTQHINPWEPNF